MHPALHALLTLTALLAIGAGVWKILVTLVAGIIPPKMPPGYPPLIEYSPALVLLLILLELACGFAMFFAGAIGLGQLAVSP